LIDWLIDWLLLNPNFNNISAMSWRDANIIKKKKKSKKKSHCHNSSRIHQNNRRKKRQSIPLTCLAWYRHFNTKCRG
jgi:hypothetical protein